MLSPWYNRTGWLGVKHQLTYLLLCLLVLLSSSVPKVTLKVTSAFLLISFQFNAMFLCCGKLMCTPPRLADQSPVLPMKQFQCWSHFGDGPFSSFLGNCQVFPLSMPISPPGYQCVVWCLWLCASRQCLKLLNTSHLQKPKPCVIVVLPTSHGHLPWLRHVQGSHIHQWMVDVNLWQMSVWACTFSLSLFVACSLNQWEGWNVRSGCHLSSQGNPLESIHVWLQIPLFYIWYSQ